MCPSPPGGWSRLSLIARPTTASALGGGLAASAAIVTRPNLVPLAAVLGVFVLGCSAPRPPYATRAMRCSFAAGVLPGCVGLALFQSKPLWFSVRIRIRLDGGTLQDRIPQRQSVQLSSMARRDGNAIDSARVTCTLAYPHVPVMVVRSNISDALCLSTRFISLSITGHIFAFCCRRYLCCSS